MSRIGKQDRAEIIIKNFIGKDYYVNMYLDVARRLIDSFRVEFGIGETEKWEVYKEFGEQPIRAIVKAEDGTEVFTITLSRDYTVDSINYNREFLESVEDTVLICPMCQAGELEHKPAEKEESQWEDRKHTHMYICGECPFVGLEWYDHEDTETFAKGIG